MGCLPCDKEIIDNGMGIETARLYALVMDDVGTSVRPIDRYAPIFYANVVETIFAPLAKEWTANEKLSDEQLARLMERIDLQCYRADEFVAWASGEFNPDTVARWTAKILAWTKEDQLFYTAFSEEIGSKG